MTDAPGSRWSEPASWGTARRPNRHLLSPAQARQRGFDPTDWRLKLDPENGGVAAGWPEQGLPADTVPAEAPGVWNTTYPGCRGVAWYECQFRQPFFAGGTVRLVIGGANYLTDAWLNGVYLGRHEGGYDAFSFRCGHALQDGLNRLTLRIVDPPPAGEIDGLRLRACPTSKESWYGGAGGPWGGVWLEKTPRVWIEDVRLRADLSSGQATFRVGLASDLLTRSEVGVRAIVHDAPTGPTFEAAARIEVEPHGATATLTVRVPSPRAWSPESPALSWWTVLLDVPGWPLPDAVSGLLGFRTCELRDGVFFLNGEPRYLKGALLQPTFPRSLIRSPDHIARADIETVKRAGLNLIRSHLRPPEHSLLTLADTTGMMLYVEPPLAWIEPSGRLLEHGRRELAAMVRACGNHPSVVLWGIFNENAAATEAVGGDLLARLAALDPTRPIIENSGGAAVGEVGMWAWSGQTRCWSPGWDAPRPLNDLHVYLANPLRQEARQLLTGLGDGPTLNVTPGRPPHERVESRLSSDAVLVSEYGCGALPDFDAALAAFGEETHLADAALLRNLRDSLAAGLERRGLISEIGDVPALVRQTQALQAEGILAQTAALRCNPRVSGLILTQLADAGWEQMAGLVGLWRQPRPALAAFTRAMQPRLLHIEPADPCSAGTVTVRAWLIQDPGLSPPRLPAVLSMTVTPAGSPGDLTLTVRLSGAKRRESGELDSLSPWEKAGVRAIPVSFPQRSDSRYPLASLTIPLPATPGRYEIRARLQADGWSDDATCTVRRLPVTPPTTGDGLMLLGRALRGALPAALAELPPGWRGPILADLAGWPSQGALAQAIQAARAGVHLCIAGLEPATAARLQTLLGLPLTLHGARGNFMGMHHYLRAHPVFDGLGGPGLADGAWSEALPAWALDEIPGAEVLAGCFTVPDGGRGFLWRGSVQTLPFGDGRLTLWQPPLGGRRGGVLGGQLLAALVRWLTDAPQ